MLPARSRRLVFDALSHHLYACPVVKIESESDRKGPRHPLRSRASKRVRKSPLISSYCTTITPQIRPPIAPRSAPDSPSIRSQNPLIPTRFAPTKNGGQAPPPVPPRTPHRRLIPSPLRAPHTAEHRPGHRRPPVHALAHSPRLSLPAHTTESHPPDHPVGGTLAKCDHSGTPSTSHWTAAAIIVAFHRTKTCIVTRPRTSLRPMPFSSAG